MKNPPSPFESIHIEREADPSRTSTHSEAVTRDTRRARSRNAPNFTPEYRAWLARQAAKRKGRNP